MRTIVVDDEDIMLRSFIRLSEGIDALNIVGKFNAPVQALEYAREHTIDLAILDIAMPGMTGLELARKLREIRSDVLIVFVTAYDEHIREANEIGADYYLMKPCKREIVEDMAQRMLLLSRRQEKKYYAQTFGRFVVSRDDKPLMLSGKAKEIFALVVTRRGKEISNEEIYRTIWEDRPYSNTDMKVYYNALGRLRTALESQGAADLLVSTSRGQMANTHLLDCDYYAWQDDNMGERDQFTGTFLEEYSWGEVLLADILNAER